MTAFKMFKKGDLVRFTHHRRSGKETVQILAGDLGIVIMESVGIGYTYDSLVYWQRLKKKIPVWWGDLELAND